MADASSRVLSFDTGQLEHVFAQLAKRPPIHVHAGVVRKHQHDYQSGM